MCQLHIIRCGTITAFALQRVKKKHINQTPTLELSFSLHYKGSLMTHYRARRMALLVSGTIGRCRHGIRIRLFMLCSACRLLSRRKWLRSGLQLALVRTLRLSVAYVLTVDYRVYTIILYTVANISSKLKLTRSPAVAETARRFVSLNILLSHSRSVNVIQNDTVM